MCRLCDCVCVRGEIEEVVLIVLFRRMRSQDVVAWIVPCPRRGWIWGGGRGCGDGVCLRKEGRGTMFVNVETRAHERLVRVG